MEGLLALGSANFPRLFMRDIDTGLRRVLDL
jgi:hypothetical protein